VLRVLAVLMRILLDNGTPRGVAAALTTTSSGKRALMIGTRSATGLAVSNWGCVPHRLNKPRTARIPRIRKTRTYSVGSVRSVADLFSAVLRPARLARFQGRLRIGVSVLTPHEPPTLLA
jgi:hypothetical protein